MSMAPDMNGAITNDKIERLTKRVILLSKGLEILLETYAESDRCGTVEAATLLEAIKTLREPI